MTLLPQSSKYGILVDLEVSFGIKVNPMSPTFVQRGKETKCFDLSGSQNTRSEIGGTVPGESDEDMVVGHSSPAHAYSDKKGEIDSSDLRSGPIISNFGRTNTGFSASTNFSNLKHGS